MRYERINGKMVRVSENKSVATLPLERVKPNVTKWDLPTANKRGIKQGVFARSSAIVGAAALTVGVASNTETGILMDTFLEYIYPWFLEVASIYALVKIAMSLYDEQRGVGNGKSAFSTVFLYGKWLLLFYMIPFFIELLNTVGSRMAENIGQ